MASPTQTSAIELIVPPGEAQVLYSPATLAHKIQNFELGQDGTLKSVVGPALYEPKAIGTFSDKMHGIFHAGLMGGIADTLLVRNATTLYRHAGWNRSWEVLYTGLSNEHRNLYPDQFLVLGNVIVYTNGVDRALVINHDGMVTPLGFDGVPPSPFAEGPIGTPTEDRNLQAPNSLGYSWHGRIGTVGDLLDGQTGALLSGGWYYYSQWEDIHGNLSQQSAPSSLVHLATQQANPYASWADSEESKQEATELDDLPRQFLVRIPGDGPDHCVAVRLYRTPDVTNTDTVPRFLDRIGGKNQFIYPDNVPDSALGSAMADLINVPVFRVMCAHQGRLVIGNLPSDPGVVRRSQVGLPGTFVVTDLIYPDSGGSEVTGLASHAGRLLAFTENSVYELVDFSVPVPLAQGIGCVAPRSIKALPNGNLIWLARDGFYVMSPEGSITLASRGINRTVRNFVNMARARSAVAVVDPSSQEYRCALCPAGKSEQTLILTFDGVSWKRQDLGIDIADWCQTDDYRQYVLAAGADEGLFRDPNSIDPPVEFTPVVEEEPDTPSEQPQAWESEFERATSTGPGPKVTDFGGGSWTRRKDPESEEEPVDTTPQEEVSNTAWVSDAHQVFVMDRETSVYRPPDRKLIYRSGWLRGDKVGLTPIHIRTMYIGMKDAWNGDFTIRFYRNGSWASQVSMTDVKAIGPDDESSIVNDIAGKARLSSAKTHDARLFYRQVPVGLETTTTWAFEIEADFPTRLNIASFVFDVTIATTGNPRSRTPRRSDV